MWSLVVGSVTGTLLLYLATAAAAGEANKPLWEAGLIGGYLNVPQYMGSDERYSLPLVLPYVVYRGDFLEADREGVRGWLFSGDRVSLNLGFSYGLPVDNDNDARRGMPDLHLTGQVGPQLNWQVSSGDAGPSISLHIPARYTFDTRGEDLGWVVEPSIKIQQKHLGTDGKFSARADLGLLYTGGAFNAYYYDVAQRFVTPSRPAYDSDSGLHSVFLHLSSEYEVNDQLTLGAFARWRTLSPGVVEDSPLVRDDDYVTVGLGLAWSLWQSDRRAP